MLDFFIKSAKKQDGQALLVVVLVMVVSLTVGLSIASKSITNYKTSTEQAESQKALSAAEAGIEQAIKTQNSITNGHIDLNTGYNTSVKDSSGQKVSLNGGNLVTRDQGIDVWLSDYPNYANPKTLNLTINWGLSPSACENPALEVAVISGTPQAPVLTKYAFDPCPERSTVNHFVSVSNGTGTVIDGKTYKYGKSIPITSGLLARVIPIYTNGIIGVSADQALPSQGKVISSVGLSGTSQRAVTVFQGHPEISSEFFPYNLFSP